MGYDTKIFFLLSKNINYKCFMKVKLYEKTTKNKMSRNIMKIEFLIINSIQKVINHGKSTGLQKVKLNSKNQEEWLTEFLKYLEDYINKTGAKIIGVTDNGGIYIQIG